MRKVFLEDLPHNKSHIDWINSIGYKVKFEYDEIVGKLEIINYDLKTQKCKIKYNNNNCYDIFIGHLCACKIGCCIGVIKTKYGYKYNVGDLITQKCSNIKILKQIKMKDSNKYRQGYVCKCLKCQYEWEVFGKSLDYGRGCPVCSNNIVKIGINDMWTTNPELANALLNPEDGYKYTTNSNQKLDWKCPKCGSIIKNRSPNSFHGCYFICQICSDGISYPNKIARNLLRLLNQKFVSEYKPKWCKYYYKNKLRQGSYDNYFEYKGNKYILEMDGRWHNDDNQISGQTKEESKYIDNQKDKLAKEHNIIVIRIDCSSNNFENFKYNILNSELNLLFDIKNVNWEEINKLSLNSLLIESCKMWNNGIQNINTIANHFNLTRNTIIRYLKNGAKINLCNYNPKEQMKKRGISLGKWTGKKVICITTNNIYSSMHGAQRLEGVSSSLICYCCKRKRKSAGKLPDGTKLKWMYLSDYMQQNGYTDISQIPDVIIHNENQETQLAS